MANPNIGELFKDRRVVIGASVVGLAAVAGLVFFFVSQQQPAPEPEQAATPPAMTTPAVAPSGNPGSPGTTTPAAPTGTPTATQVKPTGPPKARSAFDGAPASFVFAGGGAPGQPVSTTPAPSTGPTDTATAKVPLTPIKPNVQAAAFRADPFVSYRIPKIERPGAFNFVAPIRIASRPQPKVKPATGDPTLDFGPLPFVPRRVAGVLYNGQVSAILETGTPGQDGTQIQIIQPGASVPSGVPGLADLTVATISPTQVVLRAEDGRTVTVPLSAVPDAYISAFRGAVGGDPGTGGAGGGGEGAPGLGAAPPGAGGGRGGLQ